MKRPDTILLDFGGVIAEEGFREGLREIGRRNGIEPDRFFRDAERIIAETGYLTGAAGETVFWEAVRKETGVNESDGRMRAEILGRFTLRPAVLGRVDRLRASGLRTAILSDQTNWLEEIDAATGLYRRFDRVFNSFRMGKSKRDPSVFTDTCLSLGSEPSATLFVDDNPGHIGRAAGKGLRTILFTTVGEFEKQIEEMTGSI